MQSIEYPIYRSININPKGCLLLPDDYLTLDSSKAIRKVLDRLEDK